MQVSGAATGRCTVPGGGSPAATKSGARIPASPGEGERRRGESGRLEVCDRAEHGVGADGAVRSRYRAPSSTPPLNAAFAGTHYGS
jgi:hypothetical protein